MPGSIDYDKVSSISVQQVRVFLECFELRNYSRAAERLHFTPSMVSKNIRALEDALGLRLFVRNGSLMLPTPAARELAYGWRSVQSQLYDSIDKALAIQNEGTSTVRIGLLGSTTFCSEFVLEMLGHANDPDLLDRIVWERRDMHELPGLLAGGALDVIVTWSEERVMLGDDAHYRSIYQSPNALLYPDSLIGLPNRRDNLEEFAGCPFISLAPERYPHYYRYLLRICAKHGFAPHVAVTCGSTDSALYNLQLGKGAYIAPSLLVSDWASADIEALELQSDPSTDTGLIVAWTSMHNPLVRKVVSVLTYWPDKDTAWLARDDRDGADDETKSSIKNS